MTTGAGANLSQVTLAHFGHVLALAYAAQSQTCSSKQPNPIRKITTTPHAGMPAEVAIEVKEVAWHSVATPEEVLQALQSSKEGLSSEEAAKRLAE